MRYFDEHKTYFAHFTNIQAIAEWEDFATELSKGQLELYDYWQTLDMRESFENGEREISTKERAQISKADELVRKFLLPTILKHERITEYNALGTPRPKIYWWWHLKKS